MVKYGTHLAYLVLRKLEETNKPLTVREIAMAIEQHDSRRRQTNLENRVRRSLALLKQEDRVDMDTIRIGRNLSAFVYSTKKPINE